MRAGKINVFGSHDLVPLPNELDSFDTIYRYAIDGKLYGKKSTGEVYPITGTSQVTSDEGTPLPVRANINFVGTGVEAVDDEDNDTTIINIGNTNKRVVAVKASSFAPDVCIPDIPVSVNQSYVLENTESVIMDNWRQTISTLEGFDPVTGIWTCPKTANYNFSVRLAIGAKSGAGHDTTNNSDNEEGDFGTGSLIACIIGNINNQIKLMSRFATFGTAPAYVGALGKRTSFIFLEQNVLRVSCTIGDTYYLKILNRTELDYMKTDNANAIRQSLTMIIEETI